MERGTRGIEITRYGEALLRYAKLIDANLRFAADELETIHGSPAGQIRIGLTPVDGFYLASPAIARLLKYRPHVEITIREGNSDTLIPNLLAGDIDFMLSPMPPSSTVGGITGEMVTRMQSVLAVRPKHPLARRRTLSFEDLADVAWIVPTAGTLAAARLTNAFRSVGLTPPRSTIQVPAHSFINISLLLEHDFVAAIPQHLLDLITERGQVKTLAVDTSALDAPIYIARRELGILPPACRELISEIKKVSREVSSGA